MIFSLSRWCIGERIVVRVSSLYFDIFFRFEDGFPMMEACLLFGAKNHCQSDRIIMSVLWTRRTAPPSLLLVLFVSTILEQCCMAETESELKTRLLQNYRRDSLPPGAPVNVSVGLAVRAITDVDQINSAVIVNVWFRQKWRDVRLSWNQVRHHFRTYTEVHVVLSRSVY